MSATANDYGWLEQIAEPLRATLDSTNSARDRAYSQTRPLINKCSRAIRAAHREEWETADGLLLEASKGVQALRQATEGFPEIQHAGYTADAMREYAEANLTCAMIRGDAVPTPTDLGVSATSWLNGLAEAGSELRRRVLDILRKGEMGEAERLLGVMDDIYGVLVTMDYSDGVTHGLRRRTDGLRAVLERTRGDLTNSLRQSELEVALEKMRERLDGEPG